jgi:hypothetical protein
VSFAPFRGNLGFGVSVQRLKLLRPAALGKSTCEKTRNGTGVTCQQFSHRNRKKVELTLNDFPRTLTAAMPTQTILSELPKYTREAVRFYWQKRAQQLEKQRKAGGSDQGLRSAVTGGAQMDGFIELLTRLVVEAGIDAKDIYYQNSLELPGYFRPNKKWDFLVVPNGQLIAALEAKSQVGPSFGNNFDGIAYEAMGRALDFWAAFRQQDFAFRPWVGYLLFVEDAASSDVQRGESLCRRLLLERHYDSPALLVSESRTGPSGKHAEPALDFGFEKLATSLFTHIAAYAGRIEHLRVLPC